MEFITCIAGFGDAGDVTLVLMQLFRGNLDDWDTSSGHAHHQAR